MPKKFGTNSKKEEAREKEQTKKKEARADEVKKVEDYQWAETDDKVLKKLDKDKEKEQKRLEILKRKQENKELVEKEMEELLKTKTKDVVKAPTRAEIQEHKEKEIKKIVEKNKEQTKEITDEIDIDKVFINENYKNAIMSESGVEVIDASGVDDTLDELTAVEYDKHPEKRMRAAWNAYFEKELPAYREANPGFKRTQLINMIQKEFKKSPENPIYKQKVQMAKQAMNQNEK